MELGAMRSEFETSDIYDSEFDSSKSGYNRERILQYIAAGILFPDEIRHAEQMLRKVNAKNGLS
jgi:hypothetical protein